MYLKFVLNVKMIFFMCFILIVFDNNSARKIRDNQDTFLVAGGYRPPDIKQLAKYVVSIRMKSAEGMFFGAGHFCGGSIISEKVVLTAAHCCFDPKTSLKFSHKRLIAVAGAPKRTAKSKDTQVMNVHRVITHTKYNPETIENDIAIIKLKSSITKNPSVEIVSIANEDPPAQLPVTVVGWGRIYENGPIPIEIIYADLILWENDKCVGSSELFMSKQMICAISTNLEGIAACHGDSGGPLFSKNIVFGIVSFGDGCGRLLKPDYYTNVFHYTDWIKANSVDSPIAGFVLIFVMNCLLQCGCLLLFY